MARVTVWASPTSGN